ncbi:hypothetical protein [Dyadobacter bucti]|uniref:hypothetical protein n=1 Tax=Dyadobacter bucti TaxID=2572203 RepID=UPI003F724999
MLINRILALVIASISFCNSVNAQIFKTRQEIITEYGKPTSTGVADDGSQYISYDSYQTSSRSGRYKQLKVYYFTTTPSMILCHMWRILEPSSETNGWVSTFKNKFVEIASTTWKDYETNITYKITVKDGFCSVEARYEPNRE